MEKYRIPCDDAPEGTRMPLSTQAQLHAGGQLHLAADNHRRQGSPPGIRRMARNAGWVAGKPSDGSPLSTPARLVSWMPAPAEIMANDPAKKAGRIPSLILVFFVIDLGFGLAYLGDYLAGRPSRMLTGFFDLDREANIPAWYSSIQWFCVALLLGIFANRHVSLSRPKSWPIAALSLVFLVISVDEVAVIHEQIGGLSDRLLPGASRGNIVFSRTGIWMFLLGVPLVVLLLKLILLVRPYFRRAPRALVKMFLGVAIALVGAIGIEILSNFVTQGSANSVLQVLAEEMWEMLGGTITLWGSYELLQANEFGLKLDKVEV